MQRISPRSWLLAASLVLVTGILLLLVTLSRGIQPADHIRRVQYIDSISHIDHAIIHQLLLARAGLLSHWDGVVDLEKMLARRLMEIQQDLASIDSTDVVNRMKALNHNVTHNLETIERIKSLEAIVHNSRIYLPQTLSVAVDWQADVSEEVQSTLTELLDATLVVIQGGDSDWRARLFELINHIDNVAGNYPGQLGERLAFVAVHARYIYKYQPAIDELLKELALKSISVSSNNLRHVYASGYF